MPDGLNLSFLEDLLNETEQPQENEYKYPRPTQNGPLRHFDTTMRCTNYRCGSPTNFKVQGVPRCMIHSLYRLNELLIEKGVNDNGNENSRVTIDQDGTKPSG